MITNQNKGFTLLEILLVIAAIGILAAIVLVAINPNRQIEAARQAKRRSDINTITKAIQQYSIDNNGQYPAEIETGAKAICQIGNTPTGCINLSSTLVPTYLAAIPEADTNSYYIRKNTSGTSIEVTHPRDDIWNIGGTPSLDLNFASNRSLIDSVSSNNLVTFTRASGGTYVGDDGLVKTATTNEPRFDHDPVTRESLGLLVEEQRSNLLTGSEDFSPSYWVPLNSVSVSSNTVLSPDGNSNTDKFIENTNTTHKVLARNFTLTANTTYTYSLFVKSAERNSLMIHVRKSDYSDRFGASFNLSTQVATVETAGLGLLSSTDIKKYPNDWYRISITGNIGSNTSAVVTMYLIGGGGAFDIGYTGDGSSGIYLWGAQLEQGSFPTSYIPTSGSIVTRNADNASITGTNFSGWYNQSGYTIFTNHVSPPVTQNGPYPRIFNITTTSSGDVNRLNHYHAPLVVGGYRIGASVIENNTIGHVDLNTTFSQGLVAKMASRFAENDSSLSLNGSIVGNDNNSSINSVSRDILTIGAAINQQYLNSTISRFIYLPTRLPNTTLQRLTQ